MSNNRNVPKYDKQVAIQVESQPDVGGTANMLINSFRDFSQSVASISQGISKQEATSQRAILKNNISSTYRQFALDSLKYPNQSEGLDNYNKNSAEYSAGLSKQAGGYNKEYVQNLTNYYHNLHVYTIEKNAIEQNKRSESVAAYERMNQSVIDVKDSIAASVPMVDESGKDVTYDATLAKMADATKTMRQDAVLGYIKPDSVARTEKMLHKIFNQDVVIKEYQRNVQNGTGADYIKKLKDPNYHIPGLDEVDKAAVIGQLIKVRDAGKVRSGGAIAQLNHDIKAETKRLATDGGTPNQELMDRAQEAGDQYVTNLQDGTYIAQVAKQARDAATYKTPAELNEYLTELKPSADDKDYFKKNSAYEYAVKAVQQQDKAFKNNPMEQVIKDPSISDQINNYEQAYNADAVGDPKKIYTPYNSVVAKPWMQIIKLQSQRGLTANGVGKKAIRLLDNNTRVPQILGDLQASTPEEKISYINKLRDEFGEGLPFNLVMKQLVSAGMSPGLAMLRNFDPESQEAKDIAAAFSMPASVLNSELKKLGDKVGSDISKDAMSHVIPSTSTGFFSGEKSTTYSGTNDFNMFLSTTNPSDADRKSIADSVQQYAGWLYLSGKESSTVNAVKHAENVIASRYDYTKIGNQDIRIPKDYPPMAITSYAEKAQKGVSSYPWNISANVNREDAMQLIENGHWVNDPVDHGIVWVDANGRMWSDKNGKPMAVAFSDANAPAKTATGHVDSAKINHDESEMNNDIVPGNTDFSDDETPEQKKLTAAMMRRGEKHGKEFHTLMESVKGNQ